MKIVLLKAISWFADILIFMLLIRTFLSFLVVSGNKSIARLYESLALLTEPFVSPCRTLLQKLNLGSGMIDWSILLAFILIRFIARVLIELVTIIL